MARTTFLTGISAILGTAIAITGVPASAADFTFVLASLNPAKHLEYPVNMDFVDRVKKHSAGRIDFKVFVGGVLGDEREMVEQIQSGTISTARLTAAALGSICPGQMILNLPFLFGSGEHMVKSLRSDRFAALCDTTLMKSGIRPLTYWWLGVRDLYTKKPVRSIEDVKGLKLRTWQDSFVVNAWKALDAIPTPISFSELYTSMQTGVVDGAEGWLASYNGRSFYEAAPYATVIGYVNIASTLVISDKTWKSLPADLQQAVKKAAAENGDFAFDYFKKNEGKVYGDAAKNAKELIRVKDIAKWQAATAPVIDQFGKKYGKKYVEFIDWVKSTR